MPVILNPKSKPKTRVWKAHRFPVSGRAVFLACALAGVLLLSQIPAALEALAHFVRFVGPLALLGSLLLLALLWLLLPMMVLGILQKKR